MRNRAFSLVELLVALGILAIVVSVVGPRFLAVRQQSTEIAREQNIKALNRTFAIWEAAGGVAGPAVATSEVLRLLGSAPGTVLTINSATPADPTDDISDSAVTPTGGVSSSSTRVTLPADLTLPTSPTIVVPHGSGLIYYSPADKEFSSLANSNFGTPTGAARAGTPLEVINALSQIVASPYIVVKNGAVQGNNPLSISASAGDGIYKISNIQVVYGPSGPLSITNIRGITAQVAFQGF